MGIKWQDRSKANLVIEKLEKILTVKRERMGGNPATSDDMMFAPRGVVTFKSSGKLK